MSRVRRGSIARTNRQTSALQRLEKLLPQYVAAKNQTKITNTERNINDLKKKIG